MSDSRAGLRRRARDWPSLADQVVASGSNFVVIALVARGAGPSGYAPFALFMVVTFLALGIQRALVIDPLTITVSQHDGTARADHMASGYGRSLALAAGSAAVLATVVCVALVAGADAGAGRSLAAFALALPLLLVQDATRWQFFAVRQGAGALVNDVVFAIGEISAIAFVLHRGEITTARAFTAIAVGAGIAVAVGYMQVRRLVGSPLPRRARTSAMGRSGRWLIVDFLYTWSFSQGTLFVIAAVLGARDTGVYRAMHDMFGPLRLLNLSIVTVLLPAGASAFNRAGRERLRQTTDRATRWVVIGAAAYCGALAVAGVPIVRTIYGKAYGHEILPMLFIALGYFMITTQLPMVVALKASFRARDVGMGRIVLVPLVAMSFPALAGGLGLLGAASAFLLCATASRTVIRRQYLRMLDDVEPPTRVSEHPAPVTDLSRIALEAR